MTNSNAKKRAARTVVPEHNTAPATLANKTRKAAWLVASVLCGVLLVLAALAPAALAAEVAGVKIADTAQLADTELQLNGAGVRTKFMFKVYAAALYVPKKSANPQDIYSSRVKRLNLHMLRGLDAATLQESLDEGLKNNLTAAELQAHHAAMEQLSGIMKSAEHIKTGDVLTLDMTAEGIQISINQKGKGKIADADFANLLLRVWLGDRPADASLKKGLLGS